MSPYYVKRVSCLFCKSTNLSQLWEKNFNIPLGCYPVEFDKITNSITMPFNINICNICKTYQTQYLGDQSIIYNYNANFHGVIRSSMNNLFAKFIIDDNTITNILEIGAGNGDLCDNILELNSNIKYHIIDPTYSGKTSNRNITLSFFEDINTDNYNNIDTIVMSHIFEHFYEPSKILDLFKKLNIKTIFLNFPNLESFITEDNYHVLNPEHIYYVENNFLINLFKYYGFLIEKTYYHYKHSVFFKFIYTGGNNIDDLSFPVNMNSSIDVPKYFERIFNRIEKLHNIIKNYNDYDLYIWPCSMHTTYLFTLGFKHSYIKAILDNAPHKVGKYLYGYNIPCIYMNDIINSNNKSLIILNGGCYNLELEKLQTNVNIVIITI